MNNVIYETGEIYEIGQGIQTATARQFSHIILKRDDGELIKLQNVVADDFLVPTITSLGSRCTIAFVNKHVAPPKGMERLPINNVIISAAGEAGYVVQPEVKENALIVFYKIAVALTGLLAVYGLITGSNAWLFVGGFLCAVAALTLVGTLRARRNSNLERSRIVAHFESLGLRPLASKVYA